jgi:hypothetical protein
MKKMLKYISLFLICSCAQVTSIGLKKHEFGKVPLKVIWLQIAGFDSDLFPLLKFQKNMEEQRLNVENFLCRGETWDYSFSQLRPNAFDSFWSQYSGKRDVDTKSCEVNPPFWQLIQGEGYQFGYLEVSQNGHSTNALQSLDELKSCNDTFFKNMTYWKMSKSKNESDLKFHRSQKLALSPGSVLFDRACDQAKDCQSHWDENVISHYEQLFKTNKSYFYLIRHYEILNALTKNDFAKVTEELIKIEKLLDYLFKIQQTESNMLILISSAQNKHIEYPPQGVDWKNLKNLKSFKALSTPKLMSQVYAQGARAENFCGIYHQSELISRIFAGSKQQGLEFILINPFK